MAVNEQIVTGRKFRKLVDEATKLWQRISFWTKASDVEFDDGSTAETKMGAINGITDSLASTSSNIAASAKALSQLNNKLNGCSLEQIGEDFYIVGADAVRKKLGSGTINGSVILMRNPNQTPTGSRQTLSVTGFKKIKYTITTNTTGKNVTVTINSQSKGSGTGTAYTYDLPDSANIVFSVFNTDTSGSPNGVVVINYTIE